MAKTNKRKKTEEERLRLKRECEKKRRDRIKNDPKAYKAAQEKERKRYIKRKKAGKIKMIQDLTEREKRIQRKKWRMNNQTRSNKLAVVKSLATPAASDVVQDTESTHTISTEIPQPSTSGLTTRSRITHVMEIRDNMLSSGGSSRKEYGRRRIKRDRAKVYRRLRKAEKEIKKLKRRVDCYRKRFSRAVQKSKQKKGELTPNTKVKKMLGNQVVSHEVKKVLLFGTAIENELAHRYRKMKTYKDKQLFAKVISGRILKKYRCLNEAQRFLSYKRLSGMSKMRKTCFAYERNTNAVSAYIAKVKKNIQEFLEKDECSRVCPGKRDMIILKSKEKKSKRYLNDSLRNLHAMFCRSTTTLKLSYSTFCRYRPQWIVEAKAQNRDTCRCVVHENFKYIVQKLHHTKILKENNPNEVIQNLMCPQPKEECFSKSCIHCKEKLPAYRDCDLLQPTSFQKWTNKKEERENARTKRKITIQRTIKETINLNTAAELIGIFEDNLPKFMHHVYNIKHQCESLNGLKKNIQPNKMVCHVDFAENYCCKYSDEVQGVHFGASREQITIHTGVLYSNCVTSFATISKSLNHSPYAVMAHLLPILKTFVTDEISELHFISDSPATQYRNKFLFQLFGTVITSTFPNIINLSWNYTEAGHGKGAPDGVGATLKRTADRMVAQNKDVESFESFTKALNDNISGIYMESISEHDILQIKTENEECMTMLPTFKGTMKVHQICWIASNPRILELRSLSCFECNSDCVHYKLGHVYIKKKEVLVKAKADKNTKQKNSPLKKCASIATADTGNYSSDCLLPLILSVK